MWDLQKVSDEYYADVARIGKLVFDVLYDEARPTANIETYAKRKECWAEVQKRPFALSDEILDILLSKSDLEVEVVQARKEQKMLNGLSTEVDIFVKGSAYWESLTTRGLAQDVLTRGEAEMLKAAVNYCNGIYAQLSKYQLREIVRIQAKLKENMIE